MRAADRGEGSRHDLRLFVEDVSDSANVSADEVGEPVHTVEDLSRMFNVSTKTIQRWRDQGLVSRRFLFGRRKRVGFLKSSVERFVERNQLRVNRSERFSKISPFEQGAIIASARRLAQAGGCPTEVARRVAERFGRSPEAIRYTLREFNQAYPEMAVFPGRSGRLAPEARQRIYQQYRVAKVRSTQPSW